MTNTQMGEYIIGAYLRMVEKCDFIDYNVRTPGGGLAGLNELDVIGLDFTNRKAYLCEATTHIRGLVYKDNRTTIERITKKFKNQKRYAQDHLSDFSERVFMFWSPVVPVGYLTEHLEKINGLELVINKRYAECIDALKQHARTKTNDEGNPFFRVLQILEHLRR